MSKGKKDRFALLISRVFDPFFEAPFIILLISFFVPTKLPARQVFFITFAFIYFLPALFFLWSLKKGTISDWDIKKRKERYALNFIVFLSILSTLLIFYLIGEKALIYFYLKLLLPLLIYFLITFFYKVSGHALVNSLFVLLLYLFTGNIVLFYWGILIIFLVGWARVSLRLHTFFQVILGALLPLLMLVI